MVCRVDETNRAQFLLACGFERVFGSKCRTALEAYGENAPDVSFWLGTAADGQPSAAFYLSGGVLAVSSDNRVPPQEVARFVKEQGVCEVDTNWEQCEALHTLLGGHTESSYYMEYPSKELCAIQSKAIVESGNLPAVFEVLQKSHEYYRTHYRYAQWSEDIRLKLERGLMELYLIEQDGMPVGTGSIASEDEQAGVIAAVAVIPEYRHRGLATDISKTLVNRILQKGKKPLLISGYDEVAKLYRKVGFLETGRWGELYLQ